MKIDELSWDDVKAMRTSAHFLIRRDASPKKPSPLLDVEDVRRLAQREIDARDKLIEQMRLERG
jgi:hypothetical protein